MTSRTRMEVEIDSKSSVRLIGKKKQWVVHVALACATVVALAASAERDANAQLGGYLSTAITVIQKLYAANNWYNCYVGNMTGCPDEVLSEGEAVLSGVEEVVLRTAYGHFASDTRSLFERATADYSQPDLLRYEEEIGLVNDSRMLLNQFSDALVTMSASNLVDSQMAYNLAPSYVILAATVDVIWRTAIARGMVPAPADQLYAYRDEVLNTEYALVGADSLWFQCPGNTDLVMVQTVQDFNNAFATKKLWLKFADGEFAAGSPCQNDCNIARHWTEPGQSLCSEDCGDYGCYWYELTHDGCINEQDWQIYNERLPTILSAMARDATVRTVRAGIEGLIAITGSAFVNESYCGAPAGALFPPAFANYETWRDSSFSGTHGTLVGDIDGDSRADLVALNDNSVTVARSNGATLGPTETLFSAFYGSHGTFLADVDGNGTADLIGLGDGYIGVFLTFRKDTSPTVPGGHYHQWASTTFFGNHGTLVGDVNGDGRADLVALNDNNVTVMLSTGSSFSAPVVWNTYPFYGNPTLIGDVDGDGKADLVAVQDRDNAIAVIRSSGTSFVDYRGWWNLNGAPPPMPYGMFGTHGSILADVDGDGMADLVALDDGSVHVFRSNGTVFSSYETWWYGGFYGSDGTWAADFDGNGKADLLGAGQGYVGFIRSE